MRKPTAQERGLMLTYMPFYFLVLVSITPYVWCDVMFMVCDVPVYWFFLGDYVLFTVSLTIAWHYMMRDAWKWITD